MLILGIESTCDETSAAIVKDGHEILSNVIASQIDQHKIYGGVFPEVASRLHTDAIINVVDQAIKEAKINIQDIDLIAVAKGPGLIGSLLVGLNTAKALSVGWSKPFIGINHVEAHLYAAMMGNPFFPIFPAIGVVVSGGHSLILEMHSIGEYSLIGTTVDDAVGECFDKVARILGFPYPGGPNIEKAAKEGDPSKFSFKAGKTKDSLFNFSFSGLKTSVLYTVKGQQNSKSEDSIIDKEDFKHIAAAFQEAAFQDIADKTLLAIKQYEGKALYFGGGVTNNQRLREIFKNKSPSLPVFWPPSGLSLDNAAMIAGLAYHKYLNNKKNDLYDLLPQTKLSLV
jgi:N6-L-threonylcarbamoyladenine synthase